MPAPSRLLLARVTGVGSIAWAFMDGDRPSAQGHIFDISQFGENPTVYTALAGLVAVLEGEGPVTVNLIPGAGDSEAEAADEQSWGYDQPRTPEAAAHLQAAEAMQRP